VIAVRESMGNAAAIKLAHAVLKALWEQEKNPGDAATLDALIASVDLDPAKVTAMAADPRIAARREADTKMAIERGVFGAPSYVIDGEIFWGQDRVDFVERKLAKG
jgi:2-hydroxychromene-2-carboxylate isomerase